MDEDDRRIDLGRAIWTNLQPDEPLLLEFPSDVPGMLNVRMPVGYNVKTMTQSVARAGGQVINIDRDHPHYWVFCVRDLRPTSAALQQLPTGRPEGYRGGWANWYAPAESR